ncbi:MAG: CHRD domain-containing protein [Leptolyngbyaceae cyanobacterium bins.349]|nr:CHRD domain-containing protein [Leptolyngbyaceae cyanobacterium bins.349]
MEGFDTNQRTAQHTTTHAADLATATGFSSTATHSKAVSVQDAQLEQALNQALPTDEHDHAPKVNTNPALHIDLSQVASPRSLDTTKVERIDSLRDSLGAKGDYLNPKGGNNTVIASGDSDVIRGAGGGLNTITTGTGRDTIILGRETTNRIFDFDPTSDRFALAGLNPKNIIIAQGKNPGKGGLDQPLDSVNNTLIIDKKSGHILAALTFTKASDLSENHFVKLTPEANGSLKNLKEEGFKSQKGDGKLTGTQGRDRLIGGAGDDFLYVGDDGFRFATASGQGGTEFPFPTDSSGSTQLNLDLKSGSLKINGTYQGFDGFPLFSQGETTIDPNARILNGSDPKALVDGFLRVPKDVEGNPISGTHLHFSPAGDARGNFADATVVRFFTNTPTDAKSGTIAGEFELKPEEQAALLAGNLYVNVHTNIDGDQDGKAGFPTGENRINLNRNVIQFA